LNKIHPRLHGELLVDGVEVVNGTIVCGDVDDGPIVCSDIDGTLADICDGSIDDALDGNEGVIEIDSNGIDDEAFDGKIIGREDG